MKRLTVGPIVLAALLGVGACTSSTPSTGSVAGVTSTPAASSGTSAGSASTTSATPTTSSTAAAATTTASDPATPTAYPAADVCTYLASQIPVLTAIGSPVGREANLAANLFGFLDGRGIQPDGAQLDAATTAQCPDVRTQILTLTGLSSLAQM